MCLTQFSGVYYTVYCVWCDNEEMRVRHGSLALVLASICSFTCPFRMIIKFCLGSIKTDAFDSVIANFYRHKIYNNEPYTKCEHLHLIAQFPHNAERTQALCAAYKRMTMIFEWIDFIFFEKSTAFLDMLIKNLLKNM